MNRPISGIEPRRRLLAFRTEEAGSSLIQFGILAPVLVVLSFGILDFTLLAFDYHRATEATRRGVRTAVVERARSGLDTANSTLCGTCSATAAQSSQPGGSFDRIVQSMQAILPSIKAENVTVRYEYSGIGNADTLAGVLPLITVELTGLHRDFLLLDAIPSMPDGIDLPPFTSTLLGPGNAVSAN